MKILFIAVTAFFCNLAVAQSTGVPATGTNKINAGSLLSQFAGAIKPSLFKKEFSLQNFTGAASTVKTMNGAAGLLKNLEGALRPEAMVSSWPGRRKAWLNALNLLK